MRVEDELNDRYGFDAPLFTSNERSFSLPTDADEVSLQINYMVEQLLKSIKISNKHTVEDDSYSLTYQVPQTYTTSVVDEYSTDEYAIAA